MRQFLTLLNKVVPETSTEIVDSCATPIMIAGSPKSSTFDTIEMIRNEFKAGAVGTVAVKASYVTKLFCK